MSKTYSTETISQTLGGQLIGNGTLAIARVVHPSEARDAHDIALAVDSKLIPLLKTTKARAAIISEDAEIEPGLMEACITITRPRLALAKLTHLFAETSLVPKGIHSTVIIEDGVEIGANVTIGAYSVISSGTKIGANSTLHSQTTIGPHSVIGENALIYSGVRMGSRTIVGKNAIIHFNATIGADGFSFVTPQIGSVEAAKSSSGTEVTASNFELIRIASLGNVVIGDNVEIGANTSIDRGTIAATRIGSGSKIDNQVQIGHNVVIGENCMLCGHVGIAGSVTLGNRVVLGGATGVADHVSIGDDAIAMGMSGIAGNVPARTIVGGAPAVPRQRLLENMFNISRLKFLMNKIEALTERLNLLEKNPKND